MPLTATKIFMNWTLVGFTPAGGSAIVIDKVTDANFDPSADDEAFYGDSGKFPEMIAAVGTKRRARIMTGNAGAMAAVQVGVVGTLVATLNDSKNFAVTGGGALLYTLINAVYLGGPTGGPVNRFASTELNFAAYAPDGATDPLTIAAI